MFPLSSPRLGRRGRRRQSRRPRTATGPVPLTSHSTGSRRIAAGESHDGSGDRPKQRDRATVAGRARLLLCRRSRSPLTAASGGQTPHSALAPSATSAPGRRCWVVRILNAIVIGAFAALSLLGAAALAARDI